MKRADVKVGESYAYRSSYGLHTVRVVVTGPERSVANRYRFPVEAAPDADDRPTFALARHLRSTWAEVEAEQAREREAAAKHDAALSARRARWGDLVERLAPLVGGARLDDSAGALMLRITDPEQARRILAALEGRAGGEGSEP